MKRATSIGRMQAALLHGSTVVLCLAVAANTVAAAAAKKGLTKTAQPAPPLTALERLDVASLKFKNAKADFVWDYYQRASRQTDSQNGSIYFSRSGSSTEMGAVVHSSGTKDKILQYRNDSLHFYDAGNNQVRELKTGASKGQYESFLTLGFGGSGRELAKAWKINDLGSENLVDEGKSIKTEKLDLISKDVEVQKKFTHVTIWIDLERGVSLRQVFETPEHDRRTAVYSHIQVNGKIDEKAFAIPKKAQPVS